jgi:Glyoxalase-like domain
MLSVLAKGTDSRAGVVLATDGLATDSYRLRAQGSALGEPTPGERRRPDGETVRWRSARLPAPDAELGLMFLIEHDPGSAEWSATDRASRAASEVPGAGRVSLVRVELPVADVARASMRLLRDFGIQFRPSLAGGGARDASIGAQTMRLVPGARHGRTAVVLRASAIAEARRATMLGCDWLVEPGPSA